MITKEEFENLADKELTEKDGKLVYNGGLDLRERKDITELPDNLKVLDWLDLDNSGIIKLPKGLEVGSDLRISGTDIEELPDDIKIGGSLFIFGINKPFSFPKKMKLKHSLYCLYTDIKKAPEELITGWNCCFEKSTFDNLPNIININTELDISGTNIKEIPNNWNFQTLCVNNMINPFSFQEKIKLDGGLWCMNTIIKQMPNELVLGGYCVFCNSTFDKLPNTLKTCGLNVNRTNIKEFPEKLFTKKIKLKYCDLTDWSIIDKHCNKIVLDKNTYEQVKSKLPKHKKYGTGKNYRFVCCEFESNS